MCNIRIEKCPLCGSVKIKSQFACNDYLVSNDAFEIYSCMECEFLFTNNFPSANSIGKYYDASEYISHSDTKKGFTSKIYHAVRKHMIKEKMKFVCKQSGKQTGKILDVGCGTGYFLDCAKRKGWEAVGIEKNEAARNLAEKQFGLYVKREKHIYNFPKAYFDAITLWHVLEHIEDLGEMLTKIHNLLSPDGIAVIAVPNCSSYDARHYKARWAGYDVPRHLWHFTPQTMELWVKKFNFQITHKKPLFFDAFYISLLSEKGFKGKNTVAALVKAFVIGSISTVKTWSKKGRDKGSAMIYVLKKQK